VGRLRIDRIAGPPRELRTAAGELVAARCYVARTHVSRLVGLLGTPDLAPDEALWLEPCGSVHAIGLRASIGCAFLDPSGRILRVADPLGRWAAQKGSRAVVECAAGTLAALPPDARLLLADIRS
jgi:uncharacterized protein